jgi:hypothetical protein
MDIGQMENGYEEVKAYYDQLIAEGEFIKEAEGLYKKGEKLRADAGEAEGVMEREAYAISNISANIVNL